MRRPLGSAAAHKTTASGGTALAYSHRGCWREESTAQWIDPSSVSTSKLSLTSVLASSPVTLSSLEIDRASFLSLYLPGTFAGSALNPVSEILHRSSVLGL